MNDWDPMDVDIPVIGGHAGATIIPLLSHCRPPVKMSDKQAAEFCKRVQEAGTEVIFWYKYFILLLVINL